MEKTPQEIVEKETFVNPFCRFERVLALKDGYCIFELLLRDGEIVLNNIRVAEGDTGNGYGTEGLKWLIGVAEQTRSIIKGSIEPNGHRLVGRTLLAKWYKKHGFTVENGNISYYPKSLYK